MKCYEEALKCFNTAISFKPEDPGYIMNKSLILKLQGNELDSKKYFN
jgi:hypothetical protein